MVKMHQDVSKLIIYQGNLVTSRGTGWVVGAPLSKGPVFCCHWGPTWRWCEWSWSPWWWWWWAWWRCRLNGKVLASDFPFRSKAAGWGIRRPKNVDLTPFSSARPPIVTIRRNAAKSSCDVACNDINTDFYGRASLLSLNAIFFFLLLKVIYDFFRVNKATKDIKWAALKTRRYNTYLQEQKSWFHKVT